MVAAAVAGLGPLVALGPAGAAATPTVKVATRGSLGPVLVTPGGATLYRYTPDKPNDPTCTGPCAQAWPPYTVASGTAVHGKGVGSVAVGGGVRQVTFHKEPLYRYAGDTAAGDAKGQGLGGVWFVVHPAGSPAAAAKSTGAW
jgi:predicted lipoprotein with Yx(FWY)xxD motif